MRLPGKMFVYCRDIRPYVEKYAISHITTGDILIEAMDAGIITETEGNSIWADMIRKRRMLPTTTFSDYLSCFGKKDESET